MQLNEVFVPGGQPTITYVPRDSLSLEATLNRALDRGYSLISVTGPTKSGKTVLCRKVIGDNEAIWLTGGDFRNQNEFWEAIAHELHTIAESASTHSEARSSTVKGGASFGATVSASREKGVGRSETVTRRATPKRAALDALSAGDKILIVDDFHYLDPETQTEIIRSLKQRIFDGLRVIVLAVPHRAYDAVKVENEMTGRVQQVRIEKWAPEELVQIAYFGFSELNISMPEDEVALFSEQAFGSPHLMQTFCYEVCYDNGVKGRRAIAGTIRITNGDEFFRRIAGDASKIAFERLAVGPRQRSDRMVRKFRDGSSGDIYIAVLRAIAATGPASRLTYEEIRAELREIIEGDLPQAHEVTRVLQKMTEIARSQLQGEPVLEWDDEQKFLHVIDPFFAFYLRWGALDRPSGDV